MSVIRRSLSTQTMIPSQTISSARRCEDAVIGSVGASLGLQEAAPAHHQALSPIQAHQEEIPSFQGLPHLLQAQNLQSHNNTETFADKMISADPMEVNNQNYNAAPSQRGATLLAYFPEEEKLPGKRSPHTFRAKNLQTQSMMISEDHASNFLCQEAVLVLPLEDEKTSGNKVPCRLNIENLQSKYASECSKTNMTIGVPMETEDQYDVFSRYLAVQMRQLSFHNSVKLQKEIQSLISAKISEQNNEKDQIESNTQTHIIEQAMIDSGIDIYPKCPACSEPSIVEPVSCAITCQSCQTVTYYTGIFTNLQTENESEVNHNSAMQSCVENDAANPKDITLNNPLIGENFNDVREDPGTFKVLCQVCNRFVRYDLIDSHKNYICSGIFQFLTCATCEDELLYYSLEEYMQHRKVRHGETIKLEDIEKM